jgi:hypothetical protein
MAIISRSIKVQSSKFQISSSGAKKPLVQKFATLERALFVVSGRLAGLITTTPESASFSLLPLFNKYQLPVRES